MPIEVKIIQKVIPNKSLKIDTTGVTEGSITSRALILLTEKPKKPAAKTIYDLTKRGETQIKLSNANPDILEITSKQANGTHKESLTPTNFTNPWELKNYMVAVIKRFTGNYDRI